MLLGLIQSRIISPGINICYVRVPGTRPVSYTPDANWVLNEGVMVALKGPEDVTGPGRRFYHVVVRQPRTGPACNTLHRFLNSSEMERIIVNFVCPATLARGPAVRSVTSGCAVYYVVMSEYVLACRLSIIRGSPLM
jgi:hypothetical protein